MNKTGWDIEGIIEAYFGKCPAEPFSDRKDEWRSWQRFLDMLCATALFLKEQGKAESFQRIGAMLNDMELMEALEPYEETAFQGKGRFHQVFQSLLAREVGGKGADLPFGNFLKSGLLSQGEILAFLMAAAVDLNRKYERAFGVLQETAVPTAKPTLGLALDLCGLFLDEEAGYWGRLWDEDSFLNRFLLEPWTEKADASRLCRPLSLNRQVTRILAGEPMQLGGLSQYVRVMEYEPEMEEVLSNQEAFEEFLRVFFRMTGREQGGILHLCGEEGFGKKFFMKSLGTAAGMGVLCIDMPALLVQEEKTVYLVLKDLVLKGLCGRYLIYLDKVSFEEGEMARVRKIFSFLQDYVNVIFVGSGKQKPKTLSARGTWYVITLKMPDTRAQKRFWEIFAGDYGIEFGEDVDLGQLVSRYSMTPGRISQVMECAALDGETGPQGLVVSGRLLEKQIRMKCGAELGEYAAPMESPFTWEDLQLTDASRKLLKAACDRIRCRSVVNDSFGFAKKLPYGNGTSIVLYGPPGTGKTMAAQVLARELGLDIYRIDLSRIGSKYIGETEKNLGAVFEAAKFSNGVLFFDEADALFAKRTEVSTSNDKYANAETAYLLQKMEEYSGVSILATNVMQNFDHAFKRRMTFLIPMEQPDEDVRLKLWQNVFPGDAPLEEDIDFHVYARAAQLTGSNIKSAALSAAYRAAAERRKITNQDLIEAVDFECRRTGRMGTGNELYNQLYMRS